MIAFATMFLGLVIGVQPVTVVVSEEVAQVDFLLDGAVVATVTEEPWTANCDFGTELTPQSLSVVAFRADGEEIARTEQRINLPGSLAAATIVLNEPGDGSPTVAQIVFESVLRAQPVSAEVRLDGRRLTVPDARRFELPPYDPERIHYLSVELGFPDNVTTTVETTFGGQFTGLVGTPQTAVPVVAGKGRLPKKVSELAGSFSKNGESIRVLAIDDGPAEVVVVRDLAAQTELDRLAADMRDKLVAQWRRATSTLNRLSGRTSIESVSLRHAAQLKKGQLLWLLEPFARRPGGKGYELETFPFSPHLTPRDGGVPFILTTIRPPMEAEHKQRLADAVAVAGRGVAQRDRRRAVVLILGDGPDSSALSPAVARNYLQKVHVPLVVWSVTPPKPETLETWGEISQVTTSQQLERAVQALAQLLDRQSIVWLEGFHLPHLISLAEGKRSLEFPM